MSHGHRQDSGAPSAPDASAGYERTDAAAKPVVLFVFWLAVFTLASFAACFVMYRAMEAGAAKIAPEVHPMAVERKVAAGTPLLQDREADDLAEYLKAAKEHRDGYGWISREASVVRVPVEKGMDLVLENKELKSRD